MTEALPSIARDVFRAVAGQAPILGALIEFYDSRKAACDAESLRLTLASLARELERVKDRVVEVVEPKSVRERQVSEVSTQLSIIARRSHNPVKLEAAARLMANALLREGDPDLIEHAERQLFLNALESLSDASITLLAKAHHSLAPDVKRDIERKLVRVSFADLRRQVELDESLVMGLVAELDRFNFLRRSGASPIRGPTGLYDSDPIEITPLAARFVRFVQTESGAELAGL